MTKKIKRKAARVPTMSMELFHRLTRTRVVTPEIKSVNVGSRARFGLWSLIIFGALVVAFFLGYMFAMWGVYSLLDHVTVEQFVFSFNETQFADYMIEKCRGGGC